MAILAGGLLACAETPLTNLKVNAAADGVLGGWLTGDGWSVSGAFGAFHLGSVAPPVAHDGFLVRLDDTGEPRCGWSLLDPDGVVDVLSTAWDAEGGLWVAGAFRRDLFVVDLSGQELVHLGPAESDGFLLHFLGP